MLVTGVAGFIGSHTAEFLLKRGDRVIGIDDLNDFYPVCLKENNLDILKSYNDFVFIRGDIVDYGVLANIFRKNAISHVAHLAARAGVRPSIQYPLIYERTNIGGTLNLLELAKEHRLRNFVLTSSSSVYGSSREVPFRESDSATDRPISPYAATKKATEVLAYTYHHLYGINVNVVRPFTVYGPRGRPDMAPWLFIEAAIKGTPIRKFGNGTSRRDYTYIADFVCGFVSALDRVYGYEIFNLGNSQTVQLNDALKIVSDIAGKKLHVVEEHSQPGDVEITYADIAKAKDKLSYCPLTSFRDGMQLFFEWYNENIQQ
ncbi:MAG: GDP-mannose 4,6-dehydratase [Deltaproteobacteria bacterium]|nr:GDP-mannose 4,6-dehydratase [Deltaproteobacteria bacterium]